SRRTTPASTSRATRATSPSWSPSRRASRTSTRPSSPSAASASSDSAGRWVPTRRRGRLPYLGPAVSSRSATASAAPSRSTGTRVGRLRASSRSAASRASTGPASSFSSRARAGTTTAESTVAPRQRPCHETKARDRARLLWSWTLRPGSVQMDALRWGLTIATDVHLDTPTPEPSEQPLHPGKVSVGGAGRHCHLEPCAALGPQRVLGDRRGGVRREPVRTIHYGTRLGVGRHDAGPDARRLLLTSPFGLATHAR